MAISLALALFLLALLAAVWAVRMRQRTGLPWAPVVYQDAQRDVPEKPLFSRSLGLVGKPDYLLTIRGRTVPVEVKPSRQSRVPYDSDLMQLAAYCVLVEEIEGEPPPYGLLRYASGTFRMKYTPDVREDVLALLDEMRDVLDDDDCERNHDQAPRCWACGFYQECDQALEQ